MISINMSTMFKARNIKVNGNLKLYRLYVSEKDVRSFPNRLVLEASQEEVGPLLAALSTLNNEACVAEVEHLKTLKSVFIAVPIVVRVDEVPHKAFSESSASTGDTLTLTIAKVYPVLRGVPMPSICIGCSRQAELKGRHCPDFAEGYGCLNSTKFMREPFDLFHLNTKGDMVYAPSTSTL